MEDLALYFLWSGLVASAVSSALYLMYAFQPQAIALLAHVLPRLGRPALSTAASGAGNVTLTTPDAAPRIQRSGTLAGVASLSAWVTVTFGGLGLVFRTIALEHAPFSNLFEFSMAFGFANNIAELAPSASSWNDPDMPMAWETKSGAAGKIDWDFG